MSTVNMPAATAAAAKNAVFAPEYIVVKEKLPVSFAFRLSFQPGRWPRQLPTPLFNEG